ncbi:outer membrane beta-barrel protein [Vibrio coralliilyticus]|uniref:outer membrane beta-barrel protein n=1 Tax=Vibrio coralliilyticus TaxID=190893 RepID=UPI00148BC059|nr:outer membrane beta-barrel protein [Vibrio coralliilyticus]NOI28138.1 porin family protein [Vibrio coralliilyticus]NOI49079.1 porin family protein [Vibrio coralliilyticus]WFB47068.1 outer membrane beta-barrel protein [Vibrio coralliilyticus]
MKKTLLALALLGASATASADSWIYGSASVGQADLGGESATSYNVHVGTGILPLIGLEAGYQNLGDYDRVDYSGIKTNLTGSSVYFAVKPSLDFGPLHIYAKGGLHSYDIEADGGFKEDEIDVMYGVGAEYFVMGPISLGASYSVFNMKEDDVKNFSLNATFHFL